MEVSIEFVIGGEKTEPEKTYCLRNSSYMPHESVDRLISDIEKQRKLSTVREFANVYCEVDRENEDHFGGIGLFRNRYYLSRVNVDGYKNYNVITMQSLSTFSVEIENKLGYEEEHNGGGVFTQYYWIEVHVKIKSDKEETARKIGEIVRKHVIQAKPSCAQELEPTPAGTD